MAGSLNPVLRQRLTSKAGLIVPGAANALTARVIEDTGHGALMVTGAGIANTYLGVPDLGLLSVVELADHVAAIRDAVNIPLLVDADTGFGNAINVGRTVRLLERAGANAIMIEDQTFPKRCGHFDGKDVLSRAEMVAKLKAAVDARHDPDLMIIARSDARAVEGMPAAIDRANAYSEAGADVLFIEAPTSAEELAAIPSQVPGIHICNMVFGGKTPLLSREQLAGMGYAGIVYANAALQAALKAMTAVLQHLQACGQINGVENLIESFQERQRIVHFNHFKELEQRYAAGAD